MPLTEAVSSISGESVSIQTEGNLIRQKLPEGFQRSEFLLDHGMLDAVVEREDLRDFFGL